MKRPRWVENSLSKGKLWGVVSTTCESHTRDSQLVCLRDTRAEWHRVMDLHCLPVSTHCSAHSAVPVPQLGTRNSEIQPYFHLCSDTSASGCTHLSRNGTVGSCWQEAAPGSILLKGDRTEIPLPGSGTPDWCFLATNKTQATHQDAVSSLPGLRASSASRPASSNQCVACWG